MLPAAVTGEAPAAAIVVVVGFVVVGVRDGLERRRDATNGEFRPVNRGKERVSLELRGAAIGAEPFRRIALEKLYGLNGSAQSMFEPEGITLLTLSSKSLTSAP